MAVTNVITVGSTAVGPVSVGAGSLVLIAGPCGLESLDLALQVAEGVAEAAQRLGVPWVFKSSFDKANRTSAGAWRGPGLDAGLAMLAEVQRQFRVPVTTDVHSVDQVASVADVADLLQVPAFLCRQTDLLAACGATGKPVNVKRGQFLAPDALRGVVDKIDGPVMLTERGTTFGHGDLVADLRVLRWMRATGVPVCFDATHSVQQPGGQRTDGRREMVAPLARAAAAVGIDALFVETHPTPAAARSDAGSQVPLADLVAMLEPVVAIHNLMRQLGAAL
jgi:2-dehydro-3-deoxyphosphooctonate aldolase (KDO 8-P synthase)